MSDTTTAASSIDKVDAAADTLQPVAPPVPPAVHDFLGQLALLYGVSFEHLVPDSRMLPPESIRFFYIDSNWIESLIDGAFSIGVHSDRDIRFHRVLQHKVREVADLAAGTLRERLRGNEDSPQQPEADPRIRAGFLLRSQLVSGFPGLEVEAFEGVTGNTPKLKPLRIERLAPDLLLAIFPAIPGLVRLNEPAEGFHFGTSNDRLNGVRVPANFVGPDPAARSGAPVDVPYRNKEAGVIDVNELANRLQARLAPAGFDSANFALQMIDPPKQKSYVGGPASQV
jgi:hypothetical protein